ncbi:MAG TPA: TonB-dependent receptor [Cyclobacteriaceae bacterium]|nr:TonB-dependent receptor [Cyclobacteriaceae bacterium]
MLRKVLLSSVLITFFSLSVKAQMGTIKGHVKDAQTGEGIVGANIYLEGSTVGSAADINGDFEIAHVKTGNYNVIVSFISYKSDTIKNITVYPDQITVVNTALIEESQQLSEVVVTSGRTKDSDVSVISDIKTSQLVVAGISSQQILMSQDRDAAQIVKRIPGVTILNNRFVNVRGLSERYSVVLLNGVIAPSTEVDTRAFAFDLIPSNMIDRMLVYKSGGANLPGDFAGAVIDISTKSVVDENNVSVNITAGYRAGTTFSDFNTEVGSSTDWLGFDNGYRDLPSSFPTKNLRTYTNDLSKYTNRSVIGKAGASLNNNWEAKPGQAPIDLRTTINFSKVGYIGKRKLGNITSISYSNTHQRFEQENYFYESFDPQQPDKKLGRRYVYYDNRDVSNVRVGLISNFIFEFNPSNKIEFRNLFNQQGSSTATERTGVEDVLNFDVNNLGINYAERSLYSGQLEGKHSLTDRINIDWIAGYSMISADQPDYRRIRSQRGHGSDDPFAVVIPPSANPVDGRFFSTLDEKVYTHSLNFDYKFNPEADDEHLSKLSVGYYLAKTERDFSARWFSFNFFPGQNPDLSILTQPFNNIFTPENLINPEDAPGQLAAPVFFLDEGTTASDAYTGDNLYTAGYVNYLLPINNFKMSLGTRVEYNRQQLTSGTDVVDNPITSILPFVNLSYNFSEKSLIRLAYSKTLNRPNFRELAPFNYYDYDRNANFYGNPALKIANIHNVDLRWEKYPSKSESISLGVFYKHFIDPIEIRLQQGSNIIYSFTNAETATSIGAELEIRESLDGLTGSNFINKLNVLLNAAVIDSKVTFSQEDADNQDKERAMQGQSPYIINAGLYYTDVESGLQINAAYNVFGKRIFAVGDFNQQTGVANAQPTQYEMPRNQIDVTVSKDFGRHFNLKVGVQDILNQKYRLVQDSNSNREITNFDDPILTYRPGQYVTVGVTYKVN